MELGTVRVRVGLSYDPLRLSLSSGDLYYRKLRGPFLKKKKPRTPQTNKQTLTNNKTTTQKTIILEYRRRFNLCPEIQLS